MSHTDVQHMARDVQGVAESIISDEYTEDRAVYDICQDAEEAEMGPKNFDMVRSYIFNFHSIRFVIIAKQNTKKTRQNTETSNTK